MAECFVCDVGDGVDTKVAAEKKKGNDNLRSDWLFAIWKSALSCFYRKINVFSLEN